MDSGPKWARLSPAWCLTALAALSAVSLAGTLGAPVLHRSPLLLALLSPRMPFMVLAAADRSALLVVPLLVARHCIGDLFHFQLGRRGRDHPALARVRAHPVARLRLVVAVRARLSRHSALASRSSVLVVLVRPIGRHLAAAGAAGACPRRVAAADLLGTIVYVVGLVGAVDVLS